MTPYRLEINGREDTNEMEAFMTHEGMTPNEVVTCLRGIRERHGWTWVQVAHRLGITPGTIRQWRLGLIKRVRPVVLRRVEELELGVELENRIVELDPEWRHTLNRVYRSVERILLSRDRVAIEHLKSTLDVLQEHVNATSETRNVSRECRENC